METWKAYLIPYGNIVVTKNFVFYYQIFLQIFFAVSKLDKYFRNHRVCLNQQDEFKVI